MATPEENVRFLSDRYAAATHVGNMGRLRVTGISSDAMVAFAVLGAPRPMTPGHPIVPGGMSWQGDECGSHYPHDQSDLDACERTFALAPPAIADEMDAVMRDFRQWVLYGRNRYGDHVIDRPGEV